MITPEYLARSGTEHGEQAALFCWAAMNRVQYPWLRWMHAIPNGGSRGMKQGAMLVAEGVKGGVADVFLPVHQIRASVLSFHGLYIEMKRADGVPSNVSQDQLDFGAFVTRQGYAWYVAFGWNQAVELIMSYFAARDPLLTAHQQKVHAKLMELVNATP